MKRGRRASRPLTVDSKPYAAASVVAAIAAAVVYIAVAGFAAIKSEASIRLSLAPPPFPQLPAGPHVLQLIAVATGALLAPLGLYSRSVMSLSRSIEEASIRLVREFLGLIRSGYSVIEAVSIMASKDYGPLNAFTGRLNSLLGRGYTFEEAFRESVEMLPRSARVFLEPIADAYEAGGRAVELAGSLSSVMASINALEELRRSSLRAYSYMLATSMAMFAAVSAATVYLAGALSKGGGGPIKPIFTPEEIYAMLFYTTLWLSLLAGLIAGKLIAGTIKAGLWYSLLYYVITMATLFGAGKLLH